MAKARRTDYPIINIADGVYLINEFDSTNCYLIIGSERALLIDTGNGFGDMLTAVRNLTDLPVDIALTHGHIDHAGGYGQFENVYIHKADDNFMLRIQLQRFFRSISAELTPAKNYGIKNSDVVFNKRPVKFHHYRENHIFDLGGKTVRVIHAPGHSKGSVVLLDEQDKLMFTGDNACGLLWLFVPGGTSVEEWLPTAEMIYRFSEEYAVYPAHYSVPQKRDEIETLIKSGKELVAKTKRNSCFFRVRSYPEDGIIRILYRTDKVLK